MGVGGRTVGRGAMGYFAQPPETVGGFVPEVCPCGGGSRAEALKPECAWDEAVPVSKKYFAPGPRYFAVSGPNGHLSV